MPWSDFVHAGISYTLELVYMYTILFYARTCFERKLPESQQNCICYWSLKFHEERNKDNLPFGEGWSGSGRGVKKIVLVGKIGFQWWKERCRIQDIKRVLWVIMFPVPYDINITSKYERINLVLTSHSRVHETWQVRMEEVLKWKTEH